MALLSTPDVALDARSSQGRQAGQTSAWHEGRERLEELPEVLRAEGRAGRTAELHHALELLQERLGHVQEVLRRDGHGVLDTLQLLGNLLEHVRGPAGARLRQEPGQDLQRQEHGLLPGGDDGRQNLLQIQVREEVARGVCVEQGPQSVEEAERADYVGVALFLAEHGREEVERVERGLCSQARVGLEQTAQALLQLRGVPVREHGLQDLHWRRKFG